MSTYCATTSALLLLLLLWPATATAKNPTISDCVPAPGAIVVSDVIFKGPGTCNLDGTIVYGSVKVDGGGILHADGATIGAGISVESGGDVTLKNGTAVSSAVTLDDSGDLTVESGSTVSGNISMKTSGNAKILTGASTGELVIFDSGDVEVSASGSVTAIKAVESGGISLTDARVFPAGISMTSASGSLVICDSEIGINTDTMADGNGGVTVVESGTSGAPVDALVAIGVGCGPSLIDGSVFVLKGAGNVHFDGTQLEGLSGDLIVTEQVGDVIMNDTFLSDIKVEKLTGSVTLTGVTSDSDTSIVSISGDASIQSSACSGDVEVRSAGIVTLHELTLEDMRVEDVVQLSITGVGANNLTTLGGDVQIKSAGNVTLAFVAGGDTTITDNGTVDVLSSDLQGDLKITSNGDVTVMDNYFFLEDIAISENGSVTVAGNTDLSLSIVTNDGLVIVNDNNFTNAEISKNTGGVAINGNTGEVLNCSDNNPEPTDEGGNYISELADGQCAGF